jgi:hypothetical protein
VLCTQDANYGPGATTGCGAIDNDGNYWQYGGTTRFYVPAFPGGFVIYSVLFRAFAHCLFIFNSYSHLMKFNMTTNNWALMAGTGDIDVVANYGTRGSSGPSYIPGAREHVCQLWIDTSKNVYLFGGSINSFVADMWRWQPSTQLWTWVYHTYLTFCSLS